jgi:hypothetical protein
MLPDQAVRSRHWLIDALVGGGLALGLITAANAALPRIERLHPPTSPARAVPPAAAAPPAPAEPPALIAFQEPAPGYPVISPFGLRQLPWEEGGRLHAGVDIAAPAGTPVLAAADGVVTRMAADAGYGRFIEIKHAAGLSTLYAHLGRYLPRIAPGVAVKAGTPVGEMGSTGSSTGSHLHFEIHDPKDRPLNPELFLGRRFAETRDLPLRAGLRVPRHVRVAYVSNIPKAKREQMEARAQAELAEAAAADAASAGALSAGDFAVNAQATTRKLARAGRPRARFVPSRE